MRIRDIRERINLLIYDSKQGVLRALSVLNVLVSLTAIGVLVYMYGFHITPETEATCFSIIQASFGFYIARFLIKIIYDFNPRKFLRENWFEAIIVSILLIEGVAYNFFNGMILEPVFKSIGFDEFGTFSTIFVQLYIFIIILNNLFKERNFKPWMKIHPGWLFTISISLMTVMGGLLLMLPEMSNVEGGLPFTDSLFLSMSSVSVTGLSTVDVAQTLTFKGQVVVMVLIKLGGLNTIAFGALMLVVAKFGVGIKYHEVIEDFINRDSILKAKSMLAKIVIWATTFEIVGIILLFIGFGNQGVFADTGERFFQSVFHGISGFNNAGLSTLEGGLMHPDVINNTFVHTIIMILFFLGGFGMIYDLVLKAYAIFMFFIIGNIIGPFILAISEADLLASGKYDFMDLVFEHVSAASTVGLSTGITAELSTVGKFVLIVAMFIGRVGTLTLAYLVGKRVMSKNYKYPSGHTMVG